MDLRLCQSAPETIPPGSRNFEECRLQLRFKEQRLHKGFILWFTGLSGAGKSTLAENLLRIFRERGYRVELLDGDEVRTNLSKGLGFSKEDRDTNIRRIGYVARLLARNGVIAITAAISPYREIRDEIRGHASEDSVPFVEVYANASLDALVARDVKGLYKKALAGEIANFTGVSDPYEAPESPEVEARTDSETSEDSTARILEYLSTKGLIG
jgi:adenylyl-sulfate kinase